MSTLQKRSTRLAPYFKSGRRGMAVAVAGSLVMALTEPALPALMKPLIDQGFGKADIPLWLVPVVIIGLFVVRGAASFSSSYALAWAANEGVQNLRRAMFEHLLAAHPTIFARHTASNLTNTLVYEVQLGAQLLVGAVLTLVRESLTLAALLGYLIWLNWKLTLFVGVMFPLVFVTVHVITKRLRRITLASQKATDEMAYVVEENVLAWRVVRVHGAAGQQTERFVSQNRLLRRLMMKSVASAALLTPVTLTLTALALSGVIVVAMWQSETGGTTVGGFVAFITAMLMLLAPIKKLSEVMGQVTRGTAALERGTVLMDDSPLERGGTHDGGVASGESTDRAREHPLTLLPPTP